MNKYEIKRVFSFNCYNEKLDKKNKKKIYKIPSLEKLTFIDHNNFLFLYPLGVNRSREKSTPVFPR